MPWLNVPHQLEHRPGWCLPACVAMVSAFWQQPLAQEDVARWLETRPVGTPASRIVRLSRRGFDVIYTTGAPATLAEWLDQGVPPILFVRTRDLLPHWTVDTARCSWKRAIIMQIIREQSIVWPQEGPLELVAPAVAVTVEVSPTVARRRANAYLGSLVAMSMLAHNPRLVVDERIAWRFDIDLCLPDWGQVATLGVIEVDATTGAALPLTPEQIHALLQRADVLAAHLPPAPTAAR